MIPAWALVVGASIYATSQLPPSIEIVDHYGWWVPPVLWLTGALNPTSDWAEPGRL